MMNHYDLKLGYACNNHCKHCVVDPYKRKLVENNLPIDMKYSEIIDNINSEEFAKANSITITGGEPSLRPEFYRIIKYIVEKYNDTKYIGIQTNGRLMYKYFEKLKNLSDNISYVIAIHGTEEIHNLVTSNLNGNPFKETWNSLEEFKRVYADKKLEDYLRIEIVLSNYNLDTIPEITKKLIDFGLFNIGMSYPHVDGYYTSNRESAREIAFPYSKMKKLMLDMYKLRSTYSNEKDIRIAFEEAPLCMFTLNRKEADYIGRPELRTIKESNFGVLGDDYQSVCVKFPSAELETNFLTVSAKSHRKPAICNKCYYNNCCLGVWYEAVEMFGDEGFEPITEGLFDQTN